MLDKYLKIFGLDNNFSLDELEGKYKKLLKEFDTNNIEDDLKVIFLEEQVKIQEAHLILLKYYHTQEKVDQIKSGNKPSSPKVSNKKNQQKKIVLGISILLVLFIGAFIAYTPLLITEIGMPDNTETCKLVLKDNSFKEGGATSKKNPKEIYNCFKEGSIKVGDIRYTLIKEIEIQAKRKGVTAYIIKDDAILKDLITSLNSSIDSRVVIEAIETVRNYNKLISEGLEGEQHTWIWQDNKLEYLRGKLKHNYQHPNGFRYSEDEVVAAAARENMSMEDFILDRGLVISKIKYIQRRLKIDKGFLKGKKDDIINFLSNVKPIPDSVLKDIMTYLNTIDGKAIVIVEGCTNKHYTEYDRNANKDDGSCKTKKKGCMDKDYKEYDKYALINKKSDCKTKKQAEIKGCTNPRALNYDPKATKNDGSCKFKSNQGPQITTCSFDHQKYNCRKKVNSLNDPRNKLKDIYGPNRFNYDENVVNAEIANICAEIEVWKGIIKNGSCICTKKNTQINTLNKSKCN